MTRGGMDTPQDVFSWVDSLTNLEKNNLPADKRHYRLDRMRALLSLFDDPDGTLENVHVAGTKGKGSTAALIASVLHASGKKTGLYLSPHVNHAWERLTLAGEQPRAELLLRLGREARAAVDGLPDEGMPGHFAPTTFELYTLLA
ncbi:MAG TPA: bifunctional folylpolyglutamate synthase/dihydrofolate synthase, partial [bacterium]|nr:bifunctional folylpolyglutamate synthase/dihydrofolate synthase [bacterium]